MIHPQLQESSVTIEWFPRFCELPALSLSAALPSKCCYQITAKQDAGNLKGEKDRTE